MDRISRASHPGQSRELGLARKVGLCTGNDDPEHVRHTDLAKESGPHSFFRQSGLFANKVMARRQSQGRIRDRCWIDRQTARSLKKAKLERTSAALAKGGGKGKGKGRGKGETARLERMAGSGMNRRGAHARSGTA